MADRGRYEQHRGGSYYGRGSGRDYGYGSQDYSEPTRTYTEVSWIPGPLTGQGPRGYQRSGEREPINQRFA